MKYICLYLYSFFICLCKETTTYEEPKSTEHTQESIDIGRTVVISTGSIIVVVLILLIMLNIYKKYHNLSAGADVLPTQDDENIESAIIQSRLQARINRMCPCCLKQWKKNMLTSFVRIELKYDIFYLNILIKSIIFIRHLTRNFTWDILLRHHCLLDIKSKPKDV